MAYSTGSPCAASGKSAMTVAATVIDRSRMMQCRRQDGSHKGAFRPGARTPRYNNRSYRHLQLAASDVLYLLGDSSDVLLAREHLGRGPGRSRERDDEHEAYNPPSQGQSGEADRGAYGA